MKRKSDRQIRGEVARLSNLFGGSLARLHNLVPDEVRPDAVVLAFVGHPELARLVANRLPPGFVLGHMVLVCFGKMSMDSWFPDPTETAITVTAS
jgi:hypothetical protein